MAERVEYDNYVLRREPERIAGLPHLGDSKNALRCYCLDIPRFQDSLNNQTQHKNTFEEQGIRFEEWISRILEIPDCRRQHNRGVAPEPLVGVGEGEAVLLHSRVDEVLQASGFLLSWARELSHDFWGTPKTVYLVTKT